MLIVQLFVETLPLAQLAPTQQEARFALTQTLVLAMFVWLGWSALRGLHRAARRLTASASARRHAVALTLALDSSLASAMGGHFDVDDAEVLAPGRCQVELFGLRGESVRLAHIGPACRVGPLEIGINLDRLSDAERRDHIAGVALKAVTNWLPDVAVGLVGAASRDTTVGVNLLTAYVPLTWSLSDAVQLHANLGVDRLGERGTTKRYGIAGQWAIDDHFTLLAERFHAFDAVLTRIGLRIGLSEQVSVDFSGARHSGSGNRLWGLGLAVEFGP